MSAITNLPMRVLSEELGCGLTVTEFLPAQELAAGKRRSVAKLAPSPGGRPFGVQIYGRDPDQMTRAAALAAAKGAALVDINMGCPGKRVTSGSCGAALMREPELAARLVRAVRAGVAGAAAVTVKMRAGWDAGSLNAPELARRVEDAGAEAVTVHGRTRQQRYDGRADLGVIRAVKRAVRVPVLANGDIVDVPSMARAFAETGCDGVMVGRAAMGNPWIFRTLRAWWTGEAAPEPSARERVAMYLRHLELYLGIAGERRAVIEMRKFAAHYLARVPGGDGLRRAVYRLERVAEIRALLAAHVAGAGAPPAGAENAPPRGVDCPPGPAAGPRGRRSRAPIG